MAKATPDVRFETHIRVVNHVLRFLSEVSVRYYLVPKIEEMGADNTTSEVRLTDEQAERRFYDTVMGREPMTEREKSLTVDDRPPLDYGTLEITLVDNPFAPEAPDVYGIPIVALCIQGPGLNDALFQGCAIWWENSTNDLDAALRRLLKEVEDYCASNA